VPVLSQGQGWRHQYRFPFQPNSAPVAAGLYVFVSFVQHGGKVKHSCFRSGCHVSFQLVGCVVDFSHLRCLHTVPIPPQRSYFLMPSLNVLRSLV